LISPFNVGQNPSLITLFLQQLWVSCSIMLEQ
jgi:hypothetical protein